MAEGSPHDYKAARQAETADIPLDYPGRGKLDVHAGAENTLDIADRFDDIVAGEHGFAVRVTALASVLETARRVRILAATAAKKTGSLLLEGFARSAYYDEACDPAEGLSEPV